MKSDGSFIAGDWGTSNLRLFLLDSLGTVRAERAGPGAASVRGTFAAELAALAAPWVEAHGEMPVVLCGMVGSNLGWVQTQALPCPVDLNELASHCSEPAPDVRIVPGLSCLNRYGATDYMRGEETQILGALSRHDYRTGRRLLCLPGTHTKWVMIDGGVVQEFVSAPTGELYRVLYEHSVLVRAHREEPLDLAAFSHAVRAFNEHPGAQLLHRLFETRARQLNGDMNATQAAGFLSGLLIASDTAGGLDMTGGNTPDPPVVVIGAPQLTRLYAEALECRGLTAIQVDGSRAAVAGLHCVQRHFAPAAVV